MSLKAFIVTVRKERITSITQFNMHLALGEKKLTQTFPVFFHGLYFAPAGFGIFWREKNKNIAPVVKQKHKLH
jgi:hypothetical protein